MTEFGNMLLIHMHRNSLDLIQQIHLYSWNESKAALDAHQAGKAVYILHIFIFCLKPCFDKEL